METVKLLLSRIPTTRSGTAGDCAGLALLISEAGFCITGTDIPAGGIQP